MNNFIRKLDDLLLKYKLMPLKGVGIFILITIFIHFGWRFWARQLHYAPIEDAMSNAGLFMANIVFQQSSWFVENILGMDITTTAKTMYFPNNGYIAINSSCSGLKLFAQFALLMLLYPGPW